jgi:hypothetical protein
MQAGSGRGKKGGRAAPVCLPLPRQAGWRGKAAAPVHVARQRLSAAPHCQARPKGSPGVNNVFLGLILKLILKS